MKQWIWKASLIISIIIVLIFAVYGKGSSVCNFADSFGLPVNNNDLEGGLVWDVPFNYFGNYYSVWGGYHPGEDWNTIGGSPEADLGKPVRTIANGQVVKISDLGYLGYLVAIKHETPEGKSFFIKEKSGIENGQAYSYPSESVDSIFSIYVHINNIQVSSTECVNKGEVIGYIIDPGGGPHLHFEIRHPNAIPSNNWSLVGDPSNWAYVGGKPTGYYLNIQTMVNDGIRDPREFIANNTILVPQDKSLARIQGQDSIYWLQNGKAYHVLNFEIIDTMSTLLGWGRDKIYVYPSDILKILPPGSPPSEGEFVQGPDFITTIGTGSNGLLIKHPDDPKVYLMENGQKRWITTEDIFNKRGYNWNDIIELADIFFDPKDPNPFYIPTGPDITEGPSEFYFLSGTLTDANGNPAQGYISAWETSGANPGNSVWTSDGNYKMALFPGTYYVYAAMYDYYSNGYLYIYAQTQTIKINANTVLNIQVPFYQLYHLTGRVTNTKGIGLANVRINISGSNSGSYTITNSDGSYDALIIEGSYTLEFVPPSGSRYAREVIYNFQVSGNTVKNISLSEQYLLSGTVKDTNGKPAQAWIYAAEINGTNPGNYGWSNPQGFYQLALFPGTYRVSANVYLPYSQGNAYINVPYQTKTVNSDTILNITYPAYQFYHLRGRVTDINNIAQPNVEIQLWDNIGVCGSYTRTGARTGADGLYDALLINGTYTMKVAAPPEIYPPFYVKNIYIAGDTIRNIRLSLEYILLEQTIAQLAPNLDLALDVFDIINQGEANTYEFALNSLKEALQIILNWPGSQLGLTVYQPDGSIYGEYQSTNPPIVIDIPNPELGIWKGQVTAIDVPYDNYPFALVAGVTQNLSPLAEANGPYSGIVGSPITFDASGSYDPDGSIYSYEWDWNNDGIYDDKTTSPTITYSWNAKYIGTVGLKVTDNEGSIAIDTASVEVKRLSFRVSGGAYNFPQTTTYKASFSMDVTGPSSPSGWLKYYYSKTRMNFVSTGITEVSLSGNTATISGTGKINGVSGYTFIATVTNGSPDSFGITIRKADGSIYYSAGPGSINGGDLVISLL